MKISRITVVEGYSIWLIPEGKAKRKLSCVIFKLSKEFKAPKFIPHVTLLSGLKGNRKKLIQKMSQLADSIKPFTIEFKKIDEGKNFQNLVLLIRKDKIIKAYSKANKIFRKSDRKQFVPHLTLLLKKINKKQRKEIISKMSKLNIKCKVKSIALVYISKKPKKWQVIKKFNLKK